MPSFASKFALVMALVATLLAAPTPSAAAQSTQTPAERNFNQGETYFKANNWAAAIPYYKAAVAADPSFAAAYYSLGLAYYQNKDPKDAADAFKMYLKYKPNDAPGLLLLGISLHAAGDNAGAVDALHRVIDLKPEAKYLNSAYYNMGVAYEDAHQLPEAMQTYIVLRTISPKDAQDLLDYMRSVDPDLKAADAAPATTAKTAPTPASGPSSSAKPASAATAPPSQTTSSTKSAAPGAPSGAAKPAPDPSKQSGLDLRNSHIAQEVAAIMPFEELDYSDKIFVMQYRDYSPENKKAADVLWAKIRAQEKDGQVLLQIPKALVISSTKTTIDVALMSDNQQSKTADTHVTLSKALSTPPARGSSITVYGVITSYTAKPFLFTVERGQLTPPSGTASSARPASTPQAPAPATATTSAPSVATAAKLPDLPDMPAARTAIQSAAIIAADDLTLNDVIFILQYRDASTANQAAAKKIWSEVLDKERDGEPLRISNALVISSTKTTVELALSDDCKRAKKADTHLILAKPLAAPARAGLVTDISGEITGYKTNPIMLTMERGQLLTAAGAAPTTTSPSTSTHTAYAKPAPAATAAPAAASPASPAPVDDWK